jgi:hypothetical protein
MSVFNLSKNRVPKMADAGQQNKKATMQSAWFLHRTVGAFGKF